MSTVTTLSAAPSGKLTIGNLATTRLGYGTMRLTGPGAWGEPADPDAAVRLLRRASDLGVTFFDTADSYGPNVAERLLRQALYPYDDEIVIASKVGMTRSGPYQWRPNGHPNHIRQQVEVSLKNLGLDRIPLYQLHGIDPEISLDDQVGALEDLRSEGKIAHIGLSNVEVPEIMAAQKITPISSVQNMYNIAQRGAEDVLDYAEANRIAFLPWFPLASRTSIEPGSVMDRVAHRLSATPSQLALAWLLHRSPAILPIPGTSSIEHLEINVGAAGIALSDFDFAALSEVGDSGDRPISGVTDRA